MDDESLHSVEPLPRSYTLLSSLKGGFSFPGQSGVHTLQDLLRIIQPLQLKLYRGSDFTEHECTGEGASYRVIRCSIKDQDDVPSAVAVKQLRFQGESSGHEDTRKQITCVLKDVEVMSHGPLIQHPNIVTLLGYGWGLKQRSAVPFLVTEFSREGSLRQLLMQRSTRIHTRLKLCSDVAAGLKALHSSGICHGDLKLENVLVFDGGKERIAKLSDFGHTCLFTAEQAQGSPQTYKGTPSYLPPELLGDIRAQIDFQQCDIWTLGLLVWETLLGGARYTETPRIQALLPLQDHKPLCMDFEKAECSKNLRLSAESSKTCWEDINKLILPEAIAFAMDVGKNGLSYIDKHLVKSVFSKTLQVDPWNRCNDASKLPLKHLSKMSYSDLVLNLGDKLDGAYKWSFEPFMPENLINTPHGAKVQMVADAKRTALYQTHHGEESARAALYVAEAYAVGFGVPSDLKEFVSWTERSALLGSSTANLILEVLKNPVNGHSLILRKLHETVNNAPTSGCLLNVSTCRTCHPVHYLSANLLGSEGLKDKQLDKLLHDNRHSISVFVTQPHPLQPQFPIWISGTPLCFAVALRSTKVTNGIIRYYRNSLHGSSTKNVISMQRASCVAASLHLVEFLDLVWKLDRTTPHEGINSDLFANLIGALAQKSPLERMLVHGVVQAQSALLATSAKVIENIVQWAEFHISDLKKRNALLAKVFSKGIASCVMLADLSVAEAVYERIDKVGVTFEEDNYDEICLAVCQLAASETLSLDNSGKFIDYARQVVKRQNFDELFTRYLIKTGNVPVFQYLADYNLSVHWQGSQGNILHCMLETGFYQRLRLSKLLEKKVNPNRTNANKETALAVASRLGAIDSVRELIAYQADVFAFDKRGLSILHHAVLSRNKDTVKAVLNAMSQTLNQELDGRLLALRVSTRGPQGNTALHLASMNCDVGIVEPLLNAGAFVNISNEKGHNSLMECLSPSSGRFQDIVSCCKILLDAGAEHTQRDTHGLSIYDYCFLYSHIYPRRTAEDLWHLLSSHSEFDVTEYAFDAISAETIAVIISLRAVSWGDAGKKIPQHVLAVKWGKGFQRRMAYLTVNKEFLTLDSEVRSQEGSSTIATGTSDNPFIKLLVEKAYQSVTEAKEGKSRVLEPGKLNTTLRSAWLSATRNESQLSHAAKPTMPLVFWVSRKGTIREITDLHEDTPLSTKVV